MNEITITRKQWHEAVEKSVKTWINLGENIPNKDDLQLLMMSIQNRLFASLIEMNLFDNKEDK